MPYLSKRSFARLQKAGNAMANLCFNLSQSAQQPHCAAMRESCQEWDEAKEQLRLEFVRRGQERIMRGLPLSQKEAPHEHTY